MKKEDIIKIIAGEFNVSEIEVMNYFDDIFDTLIECFRKNKNVNISEFGKFFLRIRLNTEGVKEKIIKFSPVKKLADDVNYNFNNLTKVRLRTLEERALDDIVKLQEADINLPEDLVIPETIEKPEEIIIEKETPSKEQVEPVSDTKEGIHVKEVEMDSGDIKESIEDIRVEKKTKDEEEDKGFDVDTEMRSFLLEHIGYTKRKEEKLEEDKQAAEIIEEEKLEEKDKALSKDKFKEELEKITAEREKLIAEIDELHPEKKETEKEEEQSAPQELDIILEKEEPLPTEKIEPEKEEEKFVPQELDIILEKEEPLLTEQTELEKEEEQIISTELDKILEKEEPLPTEKTELEKEEEQIISTELDKILEKEEPLPTEKIELEKEEEKTEPEEEKDQPVPKELDKITDEDKYQTELEIKKDLDETVIEETESKEDEKQPVPQELDKVPDLDLSQRTEDVKKEIEEIFAERNRILSEIVELDLEKPGTEEEPGFKQQEEIEVEDIIEKEEEVIEDVKSTKEEVSEESIPEKDEGDEQKDIEESIPEKDEISKMIEERKRILEKIESYKTEEFKKSSDGNGAEEPQCIDNEKHEINVEIKKDNIVKENKAETVSVETVVKSEEPVADHDEVFEKESGELRTEFTNEIETIRSSILYSKNIEEDIDKILNERRKILDNISDVELNVFDKLMEDNDKEEDDSDINKDIESLSKMKMDLGKTEFNQVAENTVVSQVPIADVVETNVEFEISSDVKQLHEEIVREDSSIKEEENMRIEDTEPKNFDDIFMQDEKKIFTKKSEEEKPENTQENFDDVFK